MRIILGRITHNSPPPSFNIKILLGVFLLFLLPSTAYAACTSPAGGAGEQDYFTAQNTFKFCNGTSWVDMGAPGGTITPAGAVMAFNLATCPSGWTALVGARGRYVVGLPSGGTLAATVGTALSNQENRAVGLHSHSVDPPNTATTTNGNHTHSWLTAMNYGFGEGGGYQAWADWGQSWQSGKISSAGNHNHTVNISPFSSQNAGSVASTNAPYIQLLYCQKN